MNIKFTRDYGYPGLLDIIIDGEASSYYVKLLAEGCTLTNWRTLETHELPDDFEQAKAVAMAIVAMEIS
jgi:S-formylglutathione hydrolase FrmB